MPICLSCQGIPPVINKEYFVDTEEEMPEDPTNLSDSLKQKFLVEMPNDFFKFWEFCKELKPSDPLGECGSRIIAIC